MRIKSRKPSVNMVNFRNDLIDLLRKYAGSLDSSEMVALAAYTTGQLMAMLDATKFSSKLALELVSKNIEEGNAQAIAESHKWMGQA